MKKRALFIMWRTEVDMKLKRIATNSQKSFNFVLQTTQKNWTNVTYMESFHHHTGSKVFHALNENIEYFTLSM